MVPSVLLTPRFRKAVGRVFWAILFFSFFFVNSHFASAETPEAAWNRLHREIRDLRASQQIDAAIIKAEEALGIAQERFGKDHYKTAQSLRDLSDLRFLKKDYLGSDRDLGRACGIWKAQLGQNHPFVLSLRRLRAERLASAEQWQDAIAEMESVRKLTESYFGIEHGAVASAYHRMGVWYGAAKQPSLAFEMFEKELDLLEKIEAPVSNRLKDAYAYLADRYLDSGNVAAALEVRLRAIHFLKKSLESDHSDLASLWVALADLDALRAEGHRSEEAYLEAVRILEKGKDAAEPQTRKELAAIYYRLQEWYASEGRAQDALRAEEKAKNLMAGEGMPAPAVSV